MGIDWNVIIDHLPSLVAGARVTLAMTGLALAVGIVVGLALALARISGIRIISWPAYAYIEFFRTTPPLVQIYFFYFGLPTLGFRIPELQTGILALMLNSGAYIAEIIRAGIQSVDRSGGENLYFDACCNVCPVVGADNYFNTARCQRS